MPGAITQNTSIETVRAMLAVQFARNKFANEEFIKHGTRKQNDSNSRMKEKFVKSGFLNKFIGALQSKKLANDSVTRK